MRNVVPLVLVALFIAVATAPATANAQTGAEQAAMQPNQWTIDKSHSSVNFVVRHFFTPVNGTFKEYDITLIFDPENLADSKIDVTIAANSVDTRNERRDRDLNSASFFETETYPTITFSSDSIESVSEGSYVAHGKLTMHGVTTDFDLPFELLGIKWFEGEMAERMGKAVAGFSSTASLNRLDYKVGSGNWAATAVVADKVEINIGIEARLK